MERERGIVWIVCIDRNSGRHKRRAERTDLLLGLDRLIVRLKTDR